VNAGEDLSARVERVDIVGQNDAVDNFAEPAIEEDKDKNDDKDCDVLLGFGSGLEAYVKSKELSSRRTAWETWLLFEG